MITVFNSTSPTVLTYRAQSQGNVETVYHLGVQPKDGQSLKLLSDVNVQRGGIHSDLQQFNKAQCILQNNASKQVYKIVLIPGSVNIAINFTNGNATQDPSKESSNSTIPEGSDTKTISGNHDNQEENCTAISIPKKKMKVSQQDIAPRPVFPCPLCPFIGKYQTKLDRHLVVHSGERKYTCRHCGKKFRWSSHHTNHERMHSPYPPFRCKVCKKVVLNKSALDNHMIAQHNPDGPAFQCEQCDKKLRTKTSLNKHAKTHLADKKQETFLCEYCGKTVSKSYFTNHLNTHTKKKGYDCQQCEMKFNCYYTRRRHVKLVHEGQVDEKRFQCTVCGKLYFSIHHLESHFIKHTDDRPFVCDVCGKTYRSHTNLKSHKNMHLGVKPFSCDVCGRKFLNYCNKLKHQRRHSEVRPHKCVACDKAFYEKQELSRHIKKNHSE